MKSCIIHQASYTSPPIIVRPIPLSHVSIVTYTLGWDDGTSSTLEVKGMAYDCYVKCGKVLSCHGTPTSPISCSTPINAL
jgi:hypothetical protein